jgi:hypothetical protein
MLLNRVLIFMRNSGIKTAIILLIFLTIMGGSAALGLLLCRPPWVIAPAVVLGLTLIGEARRAIIRYTCAGSGPLNSVMSGYPESKSQCLIDPPKLAMIYTDTNIFGFCHYEIG